MSLPVLHSFAGYSSYRAARKGGMFSNYPLLILCVIAANLPDLDFVPGVILGEAASFHRGFSHSLGACLIFSAVACFLWCFWRPAEAKTVFRLAFASYGSHLLLDYFSCSPKGTMLMWPLSDAAFYSPFMRPEHFTAWSPLDAAGGLKDMIMAFTTGPLLRGLLEESLIVLAVTLFWTQAGRIRAFAASLAGRLTLARVVVPVLFYLTVLFSV